MSVLSFNTADQPTLQIIHRRKQRERAVTNIVMGLCPDITDTQWQSELRALQGLNLAHRNRAPGLDREAPDTVR